MTKTHHTTPLLILFSLLSAACGSEGDDPFDPNGSSSQCSELFDDCTGERICVGSTCQQAFPRIYRATLEVALPQRDPNGECWDVACGLPDPFVIIWVDSAEKGRTQVVQDSLTGSWTPGEFELVAGSRLQFDIYDSDLTTDDFAAGCLFESVSAELVRLRNLTCGDSAIPTLTVLLEPKG